MALGQKSRCHDGSHPGPQPSSVRQESPHVSLGLEGRTFWSKGNKTPLRAGEGSPISAQNRKACLSMRP